VAKLYKDYAIGTLKKVLKNAIGTLSMTNSYAIGILSIRHRHIEDEGMKIE